MHNPLFWKFCYTHQREVVFMHHPAGDLFMGVNMDEARESLRQMHLPRTTFTTRRVSEQFPDSDGWYTATVTYSDYTCPHCHTSDTAGHMLTNGDGLKCGHCAAEFTVWIALPLTQ